MRWNLLAWGGVAANFFDLLTVNPIDGCRPTGDSAIKVTQFTGGFRGQRGRCRFNQLI